MSYQPIIKSKKFDPSPFAGNIPRWADGTNNPQCIGTKAHTDFWNEQIYYCMYGYDTGGLHITGRYYHFLNFVIIDGVGGKTYPFFTDLHYDLFNLIDHVKSNNKTGIIIPKKRRALMSFIFAGIMNYGFRFVDAYRAGVGASLQRYSDGLRLKLYRIYNNTPDEFKLNMLIRNTKEIEIGYEEKTDKGFNRILNGYSLFETLDDNPKKMEGEYYNDAFLEEIGLNKKAKTSFTSIFPALRLGEDIIGTLYLGGTGGKQAESADFKFLWNNSESYGLERFFIPGKRVHFPYLGGSKNIFTGELNEKIPYLKKIYPDLLPEQLLGCEDLRAASESIKEEMVLKSKLSDRKAFIEFKQGMPETVEDVFQSSGSNNFNNEFLFKQLFSVDSLADSKWKRYKLDWVYEIINGEKTSDLKYPLEVTATPAKDTDRDIDCVQIYKMPKTDYRDLDVAGIDSYNEDQTLTTDSLGCIIVVRRNDIRLDLPINEDKGRIPICKYYERPRRKEMFYDMSLKISVLYNLVGNVMCAAEYDLIIKHYENNGGRKFLALRPRSFDAPGSKLIHKYGVKMTKYSKPRMLGLFQSWVEDYIQFCWFGRLIKDAIAYNDEKIGTDWDSVDAMGYALMRIEDMRKNPREVDVDVVDDRFSLGAWKRNSEGVAVKIKGTQHKKESWEDLPDPFDNKN